MMGRMRRERPLRSLGASAALLLALSLALSIAVANHPAPVQGDIAISKRVQAAPLLEGLAAFINPLAGFPQWILVFGVLALLISGKRLGGGRPGSQLRREAFWAIAAVVALRFAVELLKEAVGSPRPLAAYGIRVSDIRDSFGFPSGHVYGDVLVYGALAVYGRAFLSTRLVEPFRILVAVVLVGAGPSRLVVGAHWPVDVLGGYVWGATALLVALTLARWGGRRRWQRAVSPRGRLSPQNRSVPDGDCGAAGPPGTDASGAIQRSISAAANRMESLSSSPRVSTAIRPVSPSGMAFKRARKMSASSHPEVSVSSEIVSTRSIVSTVSPHHSSPRAEAVSQIDAP